MARQGRQGSRTIARGSRVLLAGLLLLAAPLPAQEPAARHAANRALVQRYLEEVLSRGRLDHLDQMVAPGYVDSSTGAGDAERGPALVRAAQGRVRSLFSDISYNVDQLIAEGDKVVARYTVRATYRPQDPETRAQAPSAVGKEAMVAGITIFRIAGDRIAESWTINDQLAMFEQLGFTLEPPAAPAGSKGGGR
jgi:predicted ester cyclase